MRTTIEMAREAAGDDWGLFQEFMPEIHKLAELVRADERNSWPSEMEAMERQVNILTDALADSRSANAELLDALKLIVDSPDEESDVTAYENAVKAIAEHGSNT